MFLNYKPVEKSCVEIQQFISRGNILPTKISALTVKQAGYDQVYTTTLSKVSKAWLSVVSVAHVYYWFPFVWEGQTP